MVLGQYSGVMPIHCCMEHNADLTTLRITLDAELPVIFAVNTATKHQAHTGRVFIVLLSPLSK